MLDYKYLLLDADGTFLDFPPCEEIAVSHLLSYLNVEQSDFYHESWSKINKATWTLLEEGKITITELRTKRVKDFLEFHNINKDVESVKNLFEDKLSENGILFAGAYEFLSKLSQDYTLVLITNGISKVQHGRLKSSDTAAFFSSLFISEEIGYSKPDINYFKTVLETLGCRAEDCLVIGDSVAADIAGATKAGIDSLYLHLNTAKKEAECTYDASSYKAALDIIYAN